MLTRTLLSIGVAAGLAALSAHAYAQVPHSSIKAPFTVKDGSGTGAGSWIGYMFGGNQASGTNSAVAAGSSNVASGQGAFVGAGTSNSADGISSLVIGGFDNHATGIDSLVGAGAGNRATAPRSVIVGGGYNLASGPWSFIGGGGRETGSGVAGASAQDHIAAAKWSTIGGGVGNRAGTSSAQTGATVAGGEQNQAIDTDATVAGGTLNVASATYASIAGGQSNTASGSGATVGGGMSNAASGTAATVPGGSANLASGAYSFAAGQRAKSTHSGSFAFADSNAFDFGTVANNEFAVRATGGVRFVTSVDGAGTATGGVTLAAGGGSWTSLSDRRAKKDLIEVDGASLLAKLAAMPVYTWRYKTEASGALHMGPTAQDFRAAFGLGDSDTRITTVDAEGIALAAAQALYRELAQKSAVLAAQQDAYAELERRIAQLESTEQELAELKATIAYLIASRQQRATRVLLMQP